MLIIAINAIIIEHLIMKYSTSGAIDFQVIQNHRIRCVYFTRLEENFLLLHEKQDHYEIVRSNLQNF